MGQGPKSSGPRSSCHLCSSGRPGGIFTKSRNLIAGRDFVPKTAWVICYFSVCCQKGGKKSLKKNKKGKEKGYLLNILCSVGNGLSYDATKLEISNYFQAYQNSNEYQKCGM